MSGFLPSEGNRASLEAAFLVDRLNALTEARGAEYAIDEDALTWAGYQQLMSGQIETSFVLQEAATTMFPELARAWENPGEVGVYLGERELALSSFERAQAPRQFVFARSL